MSETKALASAFARMTEAAERGRLASSGRNWSELMSTSMPFVRIEVSVSTDRVIVSGRRLDSITHDERVQLAEKLRQLAIRIKDMK